LERKGDFIDTLTHELIHQIHIQNGKKVNELQKNYIPKKYPNESQLTSNHIFVHAIHKKIYLSLFNKTRLNRDIKRCEKSPDYKRAWEIVEKEGYENLINKFRELTK